MSSKRPMEDGEESQWDFHEEKSIPGYDHAKQLVSSGKQQSPRRSARASRASSSRILQGSYSPERPPVSQSKVQKQSPRSRTRPVSVESKHGGGLTSGNFSRSGEGFDEEPREGEQRDEDADDKIGEEELLSTAASGLQKSPHGTWKGPGFGLLGPKAKTKINMTSTNRTLPQSFSNIKRRREREEEALARTLAVGGPDAVKSSRVKDYRVEEGALEKIPGKGKRKPQNETQFLSKSLAQEVDDSGNEVFQPGLVERIGSNFSPGASVLSPRVYAAAIEKTSLGQTAKSSGSSLNHVGVLQEVKRLLNSRPMVIHVPTFYSPRDGSASASAKNIMQCIRDTIYFCINPSTQSADFSFYSKRTDVLGEVLSAAFARRDCSEPLSPYHGLYEENANIYVTSNVPDLSLTPYVRESVNREDLCVSSRKPSSKTTRWTGVGKIYELLDESDKNRSTEELPNLAMDSSRIPLHWFDDEMFEVASIRDCLSSCDTAVVELHGEYFERFLSKIEEREIVATDISDSSGSVMLKGPLAYAAVFINGAWYWHRSVVVATSSSWSDGEFRYLVGYENSVEHPSFSDEKLTEKALEYLWDSSVRGYASLRPNFKGKCVDCVTNWLNVRVNEPSLQWVRRLNVVFSSEPVIPFFARRFVTMKQRELAKSSLRYEKYLETLDDGTQEIEASWEKNIFKRAVKGTKQDSISRYESSLKSTLQEVRSVYSKAMRHAQHEYMLNDSVYLQKHVDMKLPPPSIPIGNSWYGMVSCSSSPVAFSNAAEALYSILVRNSEPILGPTLRLQHNFYETFSHKEFIDCRLPLKFRTDTPTERELAEDKDRVRKRMRKKILKNTEKGSAREERRRSSTNDQGAAQRVGEMLMSMDSQSDIPLPESVNDWLERQYEAMDYLREELRDEWRTKFVADTYETLHSEYNMYIRDIELYERHPLKPMITRTTLIMDHQLRSLTDNTIASFVNFIRGSCENQKVSELLKANLERLDAAGGARENEVFKEILKGSLDVSTKANSRFNHRRMVDPVASLLGSCSESTETDTQPSHSTAAFRLPLRPEDDKVSQYLQKLDSKAEELYGFMQPKRMERVSHRPPLISVSLELGKTNEVACQVDPHEDTLHPAIEALAEFGESDLIHRPYSKLRLHTLGSEEEDANKVANEEAVEQHKKGKGKKGKKHHKARKRQSTQMNAEQVFPPACEVHSRPDVKVGVNPTAESSAYFVKLSPSVGHVEQCLLRTLNFVASGVSSLDNPITGLLSLLPVDSKPLLPLQSVDESPMSQKIAALYSERLSENCQRIEEIENELHQIYSALAQKIKEHYDEQASEAEEEEEEETEEGKSASGSPRSSKEQKAKQSVELTDDEKSRINELCQELDSCSPAALERSCIEQAIEAELSKVYDRIENSEPHSSTTQMRFEAAAAFCRGTIALEMSRPSMLANAYSRYAWLMTVSGNDISQGATIRKEYKVFQDIEEYVVDQEEGTEEEGKEEQQSEQSKENGWEIESTHESEVTDGSLARTVAEHNGVIDQFYPLPVDCDGRRVVRYGRVFDGRLKRSALQMERRRLQWRKKQESSNNGMEGVLEEELAEMEENYIREPRKQVIEDEENELYQYWKASQEIQRLSDNNVWFGLIAVDCEKVKNQLIKRAKDLTNAVASLIIADCESLASKIGHAYRRIKAEIAEPPKGATGVEQQRKLLKSLDSLVSGLDEAAEDAIWRLERLRYYDVKLPHQALKDVWAARGLQSHVYSAAQHAEAHLESLTDKLVQKLEKEKEMFMKECETWPSKVEEFKTKGAEVQDLEDHDAVEKLAEEAMSFQDKIEAGMQTVQDFSKKERIFNQPAGDFSVVNEVAEQFEPYHRLWSTIGEFDGARERWLTGSFKELSANEMKTQVEEWLNVTNGLISRFNRMDVEVPLEIAKSLKKKLLEFQQIVPIVESLANPALKEQHWADVSEVLGLGGEEGKNMLDPEEGLTLQDLLDAGVKDHIGEVEQVAMVATKQYDLEQSLENMYEKWEETNFSLAPYKNTGVSIVKEVEEINNLLDEQLVRIQSMLTSPYVAHVEHKCKQWEAKLLDTTNLLEAMLSVQRNWLYLEPIFGSGDIMRQMPNEGRKFNTVDATFRRTMANIEQNPKVMDVLDQPGIIQTFENADAKLDEIQKGLDAYLELKRLSFPRFFFLSNDELLEILSETKDPRRVQPHLGKSFEGIASLKFEQSDRQPEEDVEDNCKITAMTSAEGETLTLPNSIYPNEGNRKGNVEVWMNELESNMRHSVIDYIYRSLTSLQKDPNSRKDWVLQWPGQVVLAVDQIMWTHGAEKALKHRSAKHAKEALKKFLDKLNNELMEIVDLVRGELAPLERTTLTALTTIDVHARDVISHLIDIGISDVNDFEWMAQLRYYWNQKKEKQASVGDLDVKIINSGVMYGCEYLGNTERLVITPLTDRCYRTLIGAIHLLYGGAPQGPAGTGKTETTKDLAKAVAIQCVVFNCSDGLDYKAMAKFFKGLASSGAWSCFDEFNRIELEVLSVIAQQILSIQKAKQENANRFSFEGSTLSLNPTCNVFITMNPGYAGRSELPDNLKALFRPCAMMVPDYALIAEIVLYSYGFAEARSMASKITQVLKLASEQLSSQHHYDYGMRAVKSIFVAAGLLKRRLNWSEPQLVLKAIEDVNIPKFTGADIPLFRGIVGDLFPDVENVSEKDENLEEAMISSMESLNLQSTEMFLQKTHELQNTMNVRHGLMVLGETCSGKSSILKVLSTSLTNLARESDQEGPSKGTYNEVQTKCINPKAIALGELYGKFDENTHEWTDGVLALSVRSFAKSKSNSNKWLIFDGPVDAVWIENMNTVLDDNKKLCLMSGEIIKLTDKMRMVFEVGDLSQASPATVSRCGMVLLEAEGLGHSVLIQSWLKALPASLSPGQPILERLKESLLDPLLSQLPEYSLTTPQTHQGICLSFIRLADTIIRNIYSDHFAQEADVNAIDDSSVPFLCATFVFSIIWSIGAGLTLASRRKFDEELRSMLEKTTIDVSVDPEKPLNKALESIVKIPEEASGTNVSVFDVFPHFGVLETLDIPGSQQTSHGKEKKASQLKWTPWLTLVDSGSKGSYYNIPQEMAFEEITVPTTELVQQQALTKLLLDSGRHVLMAGETGTGKSVGVKQVLSQLDSTKFMQIAIQFSAQTSGAKTQTIVDEKMKKRRAGVFGPTMGRKAVVFIDDLNMPAKEKYGAQPPIELLRQWMDHNGWYDRHERGKPFRKLVDLLFVAAMGPPGGGRNDITQRYVRHYNVVSCVPFSENSLSRIFGSILNWIAEGNSKTAGSSAPSSTKVKKLVPEAVSALTEIYDTLLSELRPTPAKSHYTFNLRDLTALFAGFAAVNASSLQSGEDLARLLCHECRRVFGDRLVDDEDSQWFEQMMIEKVENRLGVKWKHSQETFFKHIVSTREKEREVEKDVSELQEKIQAQQQDMDTFEAEARERAANSAEDSDKKKKKKKHKKPPLLPEDQSHLEHLKEKLDDMKAELKEARKKAVRETQPYSVPEDFPEGSEAKAATAEDGAESNAVYFGNFFRMDSEGEIEESGRVYEQCHSESVLHTILETQLKRYNENVAASSRMNLVLFRVAREHIAGISRRLSQAAGHCLLLGVGGSGRRSFARLAAFTQQCRIYEPVVTQSYSIADWQEDIKAVLQLAGLEGRKTVLLINDSDLAQDVQWEDVNNMLNTGEVPNIFTDEEYQKITSEIQKDAHADAEREWKRKFGDGQKMPPLSSTEIMDYFVKCCKRNLRVVVAMSPVGGVFRSRLRRFPALVNCCYIDWFRPWPAEALSSVAKSILGSEDSSVPADDFDKVINGCVEIHLSAQNLSKTLYKQHGLQNYITPTLYLQFLHELSSLIKSESKQLSDKQSKYSVGLKSVEESEELVAQLKQEVIDLQPVLEKSKEETASVMEDVEKQQKEADETKKQMKEEEATCSEQAEQASKMKQECEDDLAEALPALKAAQDALRNLKKSDIVEVKSMGKPPEAVKLVLETVCIMMEVKPDKVTAENGKDKVNDYWTPAKKQLLSDPKFVTRLLKYDKDNIPDSIVNQLQPYLEQPEFTPETVQKSSFAASGLCRWVRAVLKYYSVSKTVAPKREALKEAEEKYENAQKVLKEKEQQLQDVNDQLSRLMQQYEEANEKKQNLEQQMEQCQGRLSRANILIDSLGGQKEGWRIKSKDLAEKKESIVANMLLAGGMVGYLGPFPSDLRAAALFRWELFCDNNGMTFDGANKTAEHQGEGEKEESSRSQEEHSSSRKDGEATSGRSAGPTEPRFSLQDVLGDPITIRGWNANYLPVDKFSIENGIILHQSSKWPLMIDPQGQATRWIRAQSESEDAKKEEDNKKEQGVSAGSAGSSGVVNKLRKGKGKKSQQQKSSNLRILQPDSPGFYRAIEAAVQYGHHVLIENVGEELDPFLDSVLLNETKYQGSMRVIQLGDNVVEFNDSFKLYLSSRMATPHYSPETRAKVNLLNFTATPAGLQDQMLGIVVAKENPEMEQQRQQLVQETAENSMQLQQTEDKVLELLSTVEGNILDNQDLIDTLADSKQISDKAEEQLKKAEETQKTIQATRTEYTAVAVRASTLYFVVSSLHHVDPMYQFSLTWFIRLFNIALDRAKGSKRKLVERLESLIYTFTLLFYQNVCRSLFEKDKQLLSLLMVLRIIESEVGYPTQCLSYLLTGNTTMKIEHPNPTKDKGEWLSDTVWAHIDGLRGVASGPLKTFLDFFQQQPERFKFLMVSDNPVKDFAAEMVKLINNADGSTEDNLKELQESTFPRRSDDISLGGSSITVGSQSKLMMHYLDSNRQKRGHRRKHRQKHGSHHDDEKVPQWIIDDLNELTMLDHLAILRFMRPSKAVEMVNDLIRETLGREFIEPVPLDLESVFEDSSFETPLLFILSSGADPMQTFLQFAESRGYGKKTKIISLGQGQGPIAESAINEAIQNGSWVCLQNCHLAASWLPSMEKIINSFSSDTVHQDFRLWLTSMPTPQFPVSVLQAAVKMTSEPPKGLRASLMNSFNSITDEWTNSCEQPNTLRKLLFGLCFLHATTLERRKYGPLGWNIPYQFSASDLQISMNQLKMFLDESWTNADSSERSNKAIVPFKALQYLTAECNYGGRVTDAKDRRCLWALVQHLYSERTLADDFQTCNDERYSMPQQLDKQSLLDYAYSLPFSEQPGVFGLHSNAAIAAAQAETMYLFSTATILRSKDLAVAMQAGGSTEGESSEEEASGGGLLEHVEDMIEKIPAEFDIKAVAKQFPVRHEESMNTVLRQELFRFNALIRRVRESLFSLRDAEKGLVVMSGDLELISESIQRGVVPEYWSAVAYPSMKPLGSWVSDLAARIQFLQTWIENGHPNAFWISGFFFTQAFLTGTLQNYARKYKLPIDTIEFDFKVLDDTEKDYFDKGKDPPEDGAYVYGLILEAAVWNMESKVIEDQPPQQLICSMPLIHFQPVPTDVLDERRNNAHDYTCPVYRTPARRGTLSTTGHSTNYVLDILLPMHSDDMQEKWIRRGTALLCSTAE